MVRKPAESQALEIVAPRKFHQIFAVPATDKRGSLKVTYAVAGVPLGKQVPSILFCGGMYGVRWQALFMDWLAEKEGVRVIFIDRPGFGGSTHVLLEDRISTFLEIIPLLLEHLKIKHVTLASHSAGTVYALNLLALEHSILSPTCPKVVLFSPWVHQSHTSVSFLNLASMLPNTLFDHWNSVTKFAVSTAQPAFAASGGVIGSSASVFQSRVGALKSKEEEAEKCMKGFGISMEVKKELDKLVFKYAFEENTVGANDEARLCLKSTTGTGWHACEDYVQFVRNLAEVWERKATGEARMPKLSVTIFLPEDDLMIGEKGKAYFIDCWAKDSCGQGIEAEIVEMEGLDHESIVHPSNGAIARLFSLAKESQ